MNCSVTIDWLTFTKKGASAQEVIRDYLGMSPDLFEVTGFGLMGFSKVQKFNNICVCSEPAEWSVIADKDIVCVSMSGSGCRTFESASSFGSDSSSAFPQLLSLLHGDPDVHISRLDLACDDKEGYLDREQIVGHIRSNSVNSRLQKRSVIDSYDGAVANGFTVYIGSASSDFRIRIYDKAAEQKTDGHWIRVEMVLRNENSNAAAAQIANGVPVGKLASMILNDKFSFIERDDTNITRCSVCDWWQSFINDIESVHLIAREVVQHSIIQICDWLTYQIGPALATVFCALGFQPIYDILASGRERMSRRQRELVEDYNNFTLACAV